MMSMMMMLLSFPPPQLAIGGKMLMRCKLITCIAGRRGTSWDGSHAGLLLQGARVPSRGGNTN